MVIFKILSIIFAGILTSCYFFPFEFTFLPGMNTKMLMAGVSLVILAVQMAKGRSAKIDHSFFILSVIALFVSLICYAAVTINGTNDHTYSTYIVSMWVWLGGAYTATTIVRNVHGYLSVRLICNYLISICFAQCIIALTIDSIPIFKSIVDSYIVGFDFVNIDKLDKSGRLYGIGAALDVAGTRFCTALVIVAYFSYDLYKTNRSKLVWMYIISFIVISIVGNMMARTTIIGVALALLYWLCMTIKRKDQSVSASSNMFYKAFLLILVIALPIIVWGYNSNPDFKDNIRFAFEGFFSLAETGEWNVHSNNILKNMIVFPDNAKTWFIGDGYIENPNYIDPFYIGESYPGYYMNTDIGYLRFIFYFGIFGLLTFMFYFYKTAEYCARKFPTYKVMFWMILLINYIVWFKVATDIFVVFAIFLCIGAEENEEAEKKVVLSEFVGEE